MSVRSMTSEAIQEMAAKNEARLRELKGDKEHNGMYPLDQLY